MLIRKEQMTPTVMLILTLLLCANYISEFIQLRNNLCRRIWAKSKMSVYKRMFPKSDLVAWIKINEKMPL